MRSSLLPLALSCSCLAACAAHPTPSAAYVAAHPVQDPAPAPPIPTTAPAVASTTPSATQLKPMPPPHLAVAIKRAPAPPQLVVAEANKHAAQSPDQGGYFNAIVQYVFEPGSLYQVFAAPMRITDVALQPGEHIVGAPACGDTVRWVLAEGKAVDSAGVEQWHVYLKPTRPGLETNLAINTDHGHAYMLELHSYEDTYMAMVTWRFPQDEVAKVAADASLQATRAKESAPVVALSALNFDYSIQVIKGQPVWTPVQVFDDGRRTFVRFPQTMLVRETPALFVLSGTDTQLVNYRMRQDFYVVDRLIDSAELRVGGKDNEQIVRITRTSLLPRPQTFVDSAP